MESMEISEEEILGEEQRILEEEQEGELYLGKVSSGSFQALTFGMYFSFSEFPLLCLSTTKRIWLM